MTSSVKSRPKFRIIEGKTNDLDYIYNDVKEDYLNPRLKVNDILKKHDITLNQYNKLRKQIVEDTGVLKKPRKLDWMHETRFIIKLKTTGKYRVSKMIDGKFHHFGVYDDFRTALKVRDTLEEEGWNKEVYHKLRWELFGEEIDDRPKIEQIYDEFKDDFVQGHTMKYLFKKYKLTNGQYTTLSKLVRNETGLKRKPWWRG